MENKLKQKFVLVATTSVFVMLFVVLIGASFWNYIDLDQKTNQLVYLIADNGGTLPKPGEKQPAFGGKDLPREANFDTRYFVVYVGKQHEILYTDTGNIYATSSQAAQEYATDVLKKQKDTGFIDGYKYLRTTINEKDSIVFVDVSRDLEIFKSFVITNSIFSLISLVFVAIISYVLSPIAIKPIIEAYEKQKKFITNASHEIKTPLTVISANLDIIEMRSGESKWTKNSKEQIGRLDDLINRLVALSRMEEIEALTRTSFDFSQLCEKAAESYQSLSMSTNKHFLVDIQPDIVYKGNEQTLSQLCYIVLDNAFKYSRNNGKIYFSLSQNQGKVYLNVVNEIENIEVGKHNEFFDRFYRADDSRNSQLGGFGIGLSLAKLIVEKHRGKISASSIDGKTISIEVVL